MATACSKKCSWTYLPPTIRACAQIRQGLGFGSAFDLRIALDPTICSRHDVWRNISSVGVGGIQLAPGRWMHQAIPLKEQRYGTATALIQRSASISRAKGSRDMIMIPNKWRARHHRTPVVHTYDRRRSRKFIRYGRRRLENMRQQGLPPLWRRRKARHPPQRPRAVSAKFLALTRLTMLRGSHGPAPVPLVTGDRVFPSVQTASQCATAGNRHRGRAPPAYPPSALSDALFVCPGSLWGRRGGCRAPVAVP
ncbi:hypothetical protein PsYK624_009420 [Phanerochaete sordida]|uniref:Uncharacterized protein n=1 Tax=Phanerochaete sordida TaxID=48140 RepID=A0A9P3L7A8_9APHY|nr:hypothetical protein PsYK624_009420 [Phanerochaete sordida]